MKGDKKVPGNQGIICIKKDMCKALNYCPSAHTYASAVQSLLVIGWKSGSSSQLLRW